MGAGIALVTLVIVLAGPLITLAVWLWLRSRRDPVALVEPLDIGRVLSLGFRVFTPDGWPVLGLAAVLIGLPQVASVLLTRPMMLERIHQFTTANPANPFAVFEAMMTVPIMIGAIVGFLLMMTFYVTATIYLVSHFAGAPISIGEALARAPARVLPAFGAIVLASIGIVAGWMLFLLPGIILALSWMLIVPVISCENAGFFGSFSRSRWLALGSRGRILVLLLLLMVIAVLVSIPGGAFSNAFSGRPNMPGLFASIWSVVLGIVIAAFQSSMFAALYVELRRIRDGMSNPGLAEVFA
jgi:hypothetical protein